MSRSLINRSSDLLQLEQDGYRIEVRSGSLLILHDIPYVDDQQRVRYGKLVSSLELSGNATSKPIKQHVAMFVGGIPCDRNGRPLESILHSRNKQDLGVDLAVCCSFSSKPPGGYTDYCHKMSTYVSIISAEAEAIDPMVTARPHAVIEGSDDDVFRIFDNASGRIGTTKLNERFKGQRVGIVGLGGTGSYVLDFVAKTHVSEIHLIDDDLFAQHNAFRAPGTPTLEQLSKKTSKAAYFCDMYSPMRKGIVVHESKVEDVEDAHLGELDIVFVCIDDASAKKRIVERLRRLQTPMIDVGMGVSVSDDGLRGIVRVTTCAPEKYGHAEARIPMSDEKIDEAYNTNIQIAELNALNAALAVIRWKKMLGYYADLEREHNSCYTIDGNIICNEESE